ncbi:DUF4011 domain-containing protein [bacterium 1XD42-1]|nr:DUF4011 domain-containing protein [bacterium 1XD42-8]RKJ62918.1 DUF4011 domain-containing protein [bacterium 1XD42-1]
MRWDDSKMINMESKLNDWKNKLLDMGKRNQLLNYRDTCNSNLKIQSPKIYELWDSFVVNEKPSKFSSANLRFPT